MAKSPQLTVIFLLTTFFLLSSSSCGKNPVSNGKDNGREPSDFTAWSVIINEFMVRQNETITDPDFGEYSGWIELFNQEDEEVDLGGWIIAGQELSDGDQQKFTLPEGLTIDPDGFMLLWADGRGVTETEVHTSFILSETGGTIGLYGPEWAEFPIIDTISYSSAEVAPDISMGRMNFAGFDHSGFWLPMNAPSPGEENRLARLQQIGSFPLNISDPSGLGLDHTGNYFWTVSDDPGGSIYKITRTGVIVDELKVDSEDMEGITQHPDNKLLYVVEERQRKIIRYDTLGNWIQSDSVAVEIQRENDGLEGITINPSNNHIFVVNKRLPRALIELDLRRAPDQQQIRYTPVNFRADKDARGVTLAGLFFEAGPNRLWVVSDEARAVFVLDLKGRPLAAFDAYENDLEAIALVTGDNRIYLVSDSENILYEYEYPVELKTLQQVGQE